MAVVGATATLVGRRRQLGVAQLDGPVARATRAGLAVGRAPCSARYRTSASDRPGLGADIWAKLFDFL